MGKFVKQFLTVFASLFVMFFLISIGSLFGKIDMGALEPVRKDSILQLELEGVILDGKEFLENLKKYASDEKIKGVLVRINSPGGAVGPSQEIYYELKRVRDELQKPVVAVSTALVASGGYYAAVAADQIVVTPGAIVGSIGVIMQLANLKDLYDWAKIDWNVIKTGEYKDSGSSHRSMREDERALFQEMLTQVHTQFKTAVKNGRKLTQDIVEKYSDGRVFTGESAVKLGFADQEGTFEDALRVVGELAGLGQEPEVFKPPKKRPELLEVLADSKANFPLEGTIKNFLQMKMMGQPMFLMPGTMGL